MAARVDRDELRSLVRQALKDALGGSGAPGAKDAPAAGGFVAGLRAALTRGKPAKVAVGVRSAADLDRFARDVVEASGHADLKAAILSGELGFDLAAGAEPAAARPGLPPASGKRGARGEAFQMTSGVLSETKIVEIARTHAKILVGSDVVLTPLARDKAREMKVELVRQKP